MSLPTAHTMESVTQRIRKAGMWTVIIVITVNVIAIIVVVVKPTRVVSDGAHDGISVEARLHGLVWIIIIVLILILLLVVVIIVQ